MFIDGGGSGDDEESVPLLVYVVAVEIDNDKGRPEIICWCFEVQIESYPLSRGGFAKIFIYETIDWGKLWETYVVEWQQKALTKDTVKVGNYFE